MINNYLWDTDFSKLFARCFERYQSGDTEFEKYYNQDDIGFLYSIGYKPREFYDFVEDFADENAPSPTTAVLIADEILTPDDLPDRAAEWDGIPWLPRITAKARAKLHGELDPNIMYCCGGDRNFLSSHTIHPADFLRVVWAAQDRDDAIINYVKAYSPIID
ncbi:MAG: hypothetical protein ACKVHP_20625 [Verrucomicrobiales bacterium]